MLVPLWTPQWLIPFTLVALIFPLPKFKIVWHGKIPKQLLFWKWYMYEKANTFLFIKPLNFSKKIFCLLSYNQIKFGVVKATNVTGKGHCGVYKGTKLEVNFIKLLLV